MSRNHELQREVRRVRSAIGAIHDHLHAERVNEAHETCECALAGESVSQPNLTEESGARVATFAHSFNELAMRHRMQACWVAAVPSVTVPGAVSLQIGGEVAVCRLVETQMRGASSAYMGDHRRDGSGGANDG